MNYFSFVAIVLENERIWQLALALIAAMLTCFSGAWLGRRKAARDDENKYRERILKAERDLEVHCREAEAKEADIRSQLERIREFQNSLGSQLHLNTQHTIQISEDVQRLSASLGGLSERLGSVFRFPKGEEAP
jgi:hypothetical protein